MIWNKITQIEKLAWLGKEGYIIEPNIQEVVAVLKKFIIAMNKWEIYYHTLSMGYFDKAEYEKLTWPHELFA